MPALAVMNGTVFCVFQGNGQLVCSTANPPGYGFSPPVALNSGAFGIYSATSPELFVLDHVLYCVYQNADGDSGAGTFSCVSYNPQTASWTQKSPPADQYPGMSYSPAAAALTDACTLILYQDYDAGGGLTGVGAFVESSGLTWLRMADPQLIPTLSSPYISGSPSAAVHNGQVYVLAAAQAHLGGHVPRQGHLARLEEFEESGRD